MLRFELPDACQLRLLEESDADELYGLIEANRGCLAPWMPWASDQTREGTLQFIRQTRQQVASNDGFQTAIVRGGRIIGVVGFHGVDWVNRVTSIGYWLDERQQGSGIMTRAVRRPRRSRPARVAAHSRRDPRGAGEPPQPCDRGATRLSSTT